MSQVRGTIRGSRAAALPSPAKTDGPALDGVATASSAVRPLTADNGGDPAAASQPPPLTAWDQEGSPTVLSYQMPVAYRISGRNYLVLDYDDDDFIPISDGTSADSSPSSVVTPTGELTAREEHAAGTVEDGAAAGAAGVTTSSLRDVILAPASVVIGSPDAPAPPTARPCPWWSCIRTSSRTS